MASPSAAKKQKKGSSGATSAATGAPDTGEKGTPKKGESMMEKIDDAHFSCERDVRRAMQSLKEALTLGREMATKIPKESHTLRLHKSLEQRLNAMSKWSEHAEEVSTFIAALDETQRQACVDTATGKLTEHGQKSYDQVVTETIKDLGAAMLTEHELKDFYSLQRMNEQMATFADGAKTMDDFEARKVEFGKQVDLLRELTRLIQKGVQRLQSSHDSEVKHCAAVKAKKQAEEEKKLAAAAKAMAKSAGGKKKRTEIASTVAADRAVAAATETRTPTTDLWHIQGWHEDGKIPTYPLATEHENIDWDKPAILQLGEGDDVHTQVEASQAKVRTG